MKRILFVDDERQVLEGLRALLRSQRSNWDMVFVGSGAEALAELERSSFDVIVSDMKMPGMDGGTLLRRAGEKHPDLVRIVLSGYAELEIALRTVPIAHQFLTKPCDARVLANVVERACNLQALIHEPGVSELMASVRKTPTLPGVYLELTHVVSQENASIADSARVIEQDPAVCTRILRLVNSALLGIGREIESIEQAIAYLGTNMLKNLTLTVQVFNTVEGSPSEDLWRYRQQRHALLVGTLARRISAGDRRVAEDAFIAGILHDLGKIVLSSERAREFAGLQARAQTERVPLHVLEAETWDATHAEVGGHLLGHWGLPYPVVEAVANHHAPGRVPQTPGIDALTAVHVANALAHEAAATLGSSEDDSCAALDTAYLERIGIADRLPAWRELAASHVGASRAANWSGETGAQAA